MSEGDRRETMDKKAIAALAATSRPLPAAAEFKRGAARIKSAGSQNMQHVLQVL